MYVPYMHAWCLPEPEEYLRFPGTGVKGGCELPGGYWELNPGRLQEQQWLLAPETSLQTSDNLFLKWNKLNWNGESGLCCDLHKQ